MPVMCNQSKGGNCLYISVLGRLCSSLDAFAWPNLPRPSTETLNGGANAFQFFKSNLPLCIIFSHSLHYTLHNHGGRAVVLVVVVQMRLQEKGKQPQEEGWGCRRAEAAGPLPW